MKTNMKAIARSVTRILGWLAGAVLLIGALLYLDLELNMFTWSPAFSLTTQVCLVVAAAALFLVWFTARRTSDIVSHSVALAVSVSLIAAAVYAVVPEPPSSGLIFGRSPSPLWYRTARAMVLLIPLLLWILLPLRMRRSLRNRTGAERIKDQVPTTARTLSPPAAGGSG